MIFLLERGDKPEKGWGINVKFRGGGVKRELKLFYCFTVKLNLLCVCVIDERLMDNFF